jgi:predicted ATPase/DNA-binding CsgD family transcriptional regulator
MSLLERDYHLDALDGWLDQVAAGTGCIALVMGEAGIGKTSLLQHFAARQDKAARVLWGGCEALFTPHPLAPLYDIARQIGGDFPAAIAAATRRASVFNATIDELTRGPQPTILIFEDAHWADEATLDLIKFLGRRLQRIGVLLIISYRDDEVNPTHPLRSVIGDLPPASLRRLQLVPLSAAAVATLAEAAGRSAHGLLEIARGNPFFVTEALAVEENQVPATVRDAVIARLARLSAPARAIADLTAVVPGRIERWLLDEAAGVGTAGGNGEAIQECLNVGMVALEDGALAFRHELARRAAEEFLPVPQRQELHGRILAALLIRAENRGWNEAARAIPLARLAHHAEQAGDGAAVLRLAPLAAERAAAMGSHREAAAHYGSALRHAEALAPERRAELLERQSYECYLTDQIDQAIAARQAALDLWRRAGNRLKEGDTLRWLSRLSWFTGRNAEAEQFAIAAIRILENLPAGPELAMTYSNCAQLYMLADKTELALHWGGKAIALATELGDLEILSHALNNVGTAKAMTLDAHGHDDLARALRLALEGGFQEHAARAYTNIASAAVRQRDFKRADPALQDGIAYCEERDLGSWLRYMTAFRAARHLAQGAWERAAEDAQVVIQHPRVATVTKIPALVVLGLVRARRGDSVETTLAEARALAWPTGEVQRIGPIVAAQAELAWLKGSPRAALEDLRHGCDLARERSDPWTRGELAYWSWRCGAAVEAEGPAAEPFALQIAGDWRKAAAAWEALGCPYEQAMALADGDEECSLREGLAICERLGAAPLAGILRRKLRARGVRGIARGAQERTKANPHGLTARELKVLGLLVEGCRNAEIARRLFVAEKTVDHHVSAILAKLDVRSRGAAAAAANRLGLCDTVSG